MTAQALNRILDRPVNVTGRVLLLVGIVVLLVGAALPAPLVVRVLDGLGEPSEATPCGGAWQPGRPRSLRRSP